MSFDTGDGQKLGATADRSGFFYVLDRTNGKFKHATPFVANITWAKGADGRAGKEVSALPSFLGGKNQMPMASSQNTGMFHVPSNEWSMDIHNEPVAHKKGAAYLGAGFTIQTVFNDCIGSLKWEYKNRAPLWGGVLTTAGGLVVTGTPEGYLKMFDDKTGGVPWQFNVGAGIVAPPIAWEQDGQQMIGAATSPKW